MLPTVTPRRLYENTRTEIVFLIHLCLACTLRVGPQIIASCAVGFAAQWLKVRACAAELRYSTECRFAFAIDAHLVASVVMSFLLVFRVRQAYERYDGGKTYMTRIKEGLRNASAIVDVEYEDVGSGAFDEARGERDVGEIMEFKREMRRMLNLTYAFMRHGVREVRFGATPPNGSSGADAEALLNRDEVGTPSVRAITTEAEREMYASIKAENRPDAVVVKILHDVEQLRLRGALSERATIEVYREAQAALDAYAQARLIITTPTPHEYSHNATVLLLCFVFSLPFALTTLTDWTTPLVSATVAWFFYGVNEIAIALEDPFTWSLPAHALNVFGRIIALEMDAMSLDPNVKIDAVDGSHSVDAWTFAARRKWYWFLTDCFAWAETTVPYISRQIFLAALVGIGAQLLKIGVCGSSVTDSSQCLVTFDISAHRILATSLSFLLVINTDWGYARFFGSKRLTIELQSALRSLVMCGSIFLRDAQPGGEADAREINRLADILYALARISVRELIACDPKGKTLSLKDCLYVDRYGGARKLCDLLTDEERRELEFMPTHAMTSRFGMKINAVFEKHRADGRISDRFAAEAYRQVCCTLKCVQGFARVVTTPVPKQFAHLLQFLLFFFVFTTPFVFSVSYQYMLVLPYCCAISP
jgi:putative membrane protein